MRRFTVALIAEGRRVACDLDLDGLYLAAGPLPGETVQAWLARDRRGSELLGVVADPTGPEAR